MLLCNHKRATKLLNDYSDKMNITFDIYDHHITSIEDWSNFKPNQEDEKLVKFYKYTGNIEDCGAIVVPFVIDLKT